MSTSAISGYTPTVTSASANSAGTNAMTSSDFMKVMIAQLQQQDPMNPTSSSDLLAQMSQISQLQSNTDLSTNLKGLSLQQAIGAGGNLIGKTVGGLADSGDNVSGIVTAVKVQNQQVFLQLDSGKQLGMDSVTQISSATTASSSASSPVSAVPQLQTLLQSLSGGNAGTMAALTQLAATPQGQSLISSLLAQQQVAAGSTAASSAASTSPIAGILSMLGVK